MKGVQETGRTSCHSRLSRRAQRAGVLGLILLGSAAVAPAQDSLVWPREILTDSGRITVYQPQIHSYEGNDLTARAAVAYTPAGGEPVFGAASFNARLEIDREERIVRIVDIGVTDLRSPDGTSEYRDRFNKIVGGLLAENEFVLSLDRLIASLGELEQDLTRPGEG